MNWFGRKTDKKEVRSLSGEAKRESNLAKTDKKREGAIRPYLRAERGRMSWLMNKMIKDKTGRISLGKRVAVTVFGGHDGDDRCTTLPGQRSRWLSYQLKPQSFFTSRWFDKKCNKKKCDADNGEKNTQPGWQFNKKVAGQRYGKDGFGKVSNVGGRKFQPGIVKNIFHTAKVYRICGSPSNVLIQSRGRRYELVDEKKTD